MTLFADISGDIASCEPLVLVHGFGGGADAWGLVRRNLPAELPIIAYDLPGHGKSLNADGRGGAGRMAKMILADLDARGVAGFHLAGHSMGGAVSALIAMRAGERVKSLTLVAPGGMGPEIDAPGLEAFARAKTASEFKAAMRPMFAADFEISDETIQMIASARAAPGSSEALLEIFGAMFSGGAGGEQGVLPTEQLAKLACPVTVLWGAEDITLPASQMDNLPESFNKILIQGKGHMLLDEAPGDVGRAILQQAGLI